MKKLFTLSFILFSFFAQADYWTQKADFGGSARWAATGFSIGTQGYICTGAGGSGGTFNDLWEWDQVTNIWTQKSNLPAAGRMGAIGFSIGSKGYIGMGKATMPYNDFWEWDQATNTWTQKADPGIVNFYAVGFSIGSKGYIATGNFGSLWEWDQGTNVWSQKTSITGRQVGVGFSSGSMGYAGTGINGNNIMLNDFWEYNPVTDIWTQKANFGGSARAEACAFWLCPFGYVGLGTTQIGSGTIADFWKYDITANSWTQISDFGAGLREMVVAFSIGVKGYVGTGLINDDSTKVDFWEYTPDSVCVTTGVEESTNSTSEFTISPNPAKDYIVINYSTEGKEKVTVTISDVQGKKVLSSVLSPLSSALRLPTSDFQKGIYFVELTNGKQEAVKKFVKE